MIAYFTELLMNGTRMKKDGSGNNRKEEIFDFVYETEKLSKKKDHDR